jgi:glycosyltransferase involved in cell wall biosynthesis
MGDAISSDRPVKKPYRILALLPLIYGDSFGFWNRDMGLVVRTLRAMGYDAWLVALYHPEQTPGPDKPVIRATVQELGDPAWWQKQGPDAMILNTWAAPRHEAMRTAALSLGKPLVEKLDTDGIKSPKLGLFLFFIHEVFRYKYSDSWYVKAATVIRAIVRTSVIYLFPALMDRRMIDGMSRVQVFAAETPLAVARVKRFLRLYQALPLPRVVTIAHPVNTTEMRLLPGDCKENVVVAVGRWNDAQKDWPLLFAIARRFLSIRPDWKIVVIGRLPCLSEKDRRELVSLENRLILSGPLEHQQLSDWNRKAKIYLMTSYYESFNIAAAEALCCGCSVVGPSQIASSSYFASRESGTPSYQRSPDHMTDALIAEVDEWGTGQRDPAKISQASLQTSHLV